MTTCPGCNQIVRIEGGKLARHKRPLPSGNVITCLYSLLPAFEPDPPPRDWERLFRDEKRSA